MARLRPEGVPVALHHVRQGQDVGVEGLPPHDVGGVHGQPVVLCAHRLPRQHAVVAVLLPHRGHLPRLGAAEVLEGHGQLAQDAVPRLLQLAVRPPLFERPSLGRRVRRRAQLQLGVKRGHQREELRQLLVGAGPEVVDHAGQARGEDVHAVHGTSAGPSSSAGTSRPTCRGLGAMGLSGSLPLPSASLSLPSSSLSSPSSSRGALLTGEPIVAPPPL